MAIGPLDLGSLISSLGSNLGIRPPVGDLGCRPIPRACRPLPPRVRPIDRWEPCGPARACCDPCPWACGVPPVQLRYWRYLERQNIAYADVSPGVLPRGARAHGCGGHADWGMHPMRESSHRPSYAMPRIGDVSRSSGPRVVPRVHTTYYRQAMLPSGNVIDVMG